MITFEIETTITEILDYIRSVPERAQLAAKEVTSLMRKLVMGATPYGVECGQRHAKESWGQIEEHSWGYSFENPVDYSVVLEEGLYANVGPRTVAYQGAVYSRQAPRGIITPLLEDEQAVGRIMDMVAVQLVRGGRRA